MKLLREYIRSLLAEQSSPVVDKVVQLVKTGHENQALEFMLMMPEELNTTTVVARLRNELMELRAITRSPESNRWAYHFQKTIPDSEWDKFVKFAHSFSNFIGHQGRMLDPNNHNPQHRARPRDPLAKTHDRWPSAENMVQMLQQRIDEAK